MEEDKIFLVDFFCSCGGMTAGLVRSGGFEPLLAVDIDIHKLSMYKANFPNVNCVEKRLRVDKIDDKIPTDAAEVLDLIVELGVQRLNLGWEALDTWKKQARTNGARLRLPRGFRPLHVHGSPSCTDLSGANTTGAHAKKGGGKTETTMAWYTGFIHYLRISGIPHTMSMEEADVDFNKKAPNELHAIAKFAIQNEAIEKL
jgi:site-specific DNA-cytosine methylase